MESGEFGKIQSKEGREREQNSPREPDDYSSQYRALPDSIFGSSHCVVCCCCCSVARLHDVFLLEVLQTRQKKNTKAKRRRAQRESSLNPSPAPTSVVFTLPCGHLCGMEPDGNVPVCDLWSMAGRKRVSINFIFISFFLFRQARGGDKMALVMLPCELPWWTVVVRKITSIENTNEVDKILEIMQKIHDLCK
jgi:hypothetical protein